MRLWQLMILRVMMLEVVMDMEFYKVTDEVADMMVEMEINKVAEIITLVKIV